MIDISKTEMQYLTKKGVPFGENGISHCIGSYRKYYLCEGRRNMELLMSYRKSVTK